MASDLSRTKHPEYFWDTLAILILREWKVLLDILLYFWSYITPPKHEGTYDIVNYEATLELRDTKGKVAVYKKHQQVKFLQSNILAFQDYAWGDGGILDGYTCTPGVVVDRYQEGDRWNILVSLRESKNAGDVEDFHIERKVQDGFGNEQEWLQTEIRHWTQRLKVSIIFPAKRRCKRATITERSRNRTIVLDSEHFHELPDGRQEVSWEKQRVSPFEIYTLKWHW